MQQGKIVNRNEIRFYSQRFTGNLHSFRKFSKPSDLIRNSSCGEQMRKKLFQFVPNIIKGWREMSTFVRHLGEIGTRKERRQNRGSGELSILLRCAQCGILYEQE